MNRDFKGTGVAMITPFTRDGKTDIHAFEKVLKHVIEGGVNYVVFFGTTGESVTVNSEEKKELLKIANSHKTGTVKYVMGLGGNNTQALKNELLHTDFTGIDSLLSVSPYYNKPSQEGIYRHYREFAEASPLPVILYNVPSRTHSNISAATTLRLAKDCQNIIGIKEASGDFEQCMYLVKKKPEGFLVLSGDDLLTLPLISCGFDGVISVIANAYPQLFSSMVTNALNGNISGAREENYKLFNMMILICKEGNPAGIKALLHIKGLAENLFRLPLTPISNDLYNKIKESNKEIEG